VSVHVVSQYFPVVLLELSGGTEEEFRVMFAELHEANVRSLRDKSWHALIVVARKVPNAAERKLIADFSNRVPIEERRTCVAVGIITNPLLRGTMTALLWLIPGLPLLVPAADASSALQVASTHLGKAGVAYGNVDVEAARKWLEGRLRDAPR
jgi:hypothetical protein